MSDVAQMVVGGAIGAGFALVGFVARAIVSDPIKQLRDSATKQGRRLGSHHARLAVIEERLRLPRHLTAGEGIPTATDEGGDGR